MAKPTSAAVDVKLQLLPPPKIKPLISFSTLNPQLLAIEQQQAALLERHEKELQQYLTETKFVERLAEVAKDHLQSGVQQNLIKSFDSNKKFLALALELAIFLYKLYPYWTVESNRLFYYSGFESATSNRYFTLMVLRDAISAYNVTSKLFDRVANYMIWQEIEDAVANHYILIQQGTLPKPAAVVGGSGILWIKQRRCRR